MSAIVRVKRHAQRCQERSTKNATSAEAYTTCEGVLDEHGQCSEASSHVED